MDTNQLLAFDRIVREGSFSRAAQRLDIAQPTISARIQALEAELGGPLFVRGGRRVSLTARGESFLPFARRALSVLEEGAEAARLAQEGQRGRVTLGTLESLTGGFVAAALARFHRMHPQVELFVRTGHSDQVVQMLADRLVTVGLMAWPAYGADLVPLLRFREPLRLVVAAAHPLAARPRVTLADVAREGEPLLLVRWGLSVRSLLIQLAGLSAVPIEVPIEMARQLLLRGVGAAFLTQTLVEDDLAGGRLVALPVDDATPLHRESALVRLRVTTLAPATQQLVALLRAEAAQHGLLLAGGEG